MFVPFWSGLPRLYENMPRLCSVCGAVQCGVVWCGPMRCACVFLAGLLGPSVGRSNPAKQA